jgi:hypothetical protein
LKMIPLVTARYANPTLPHHPGAKVRITLGAAPSWLPYRIDASIRELAPPHRLWHLPPPVFRVLYRDHLRTAGGTAFFQARFEELATRIGAPSLVLLCFEPPGAPCHRRVFAELWQEWTGEPVPEVPE